MYRVYLRTHDQHVFPESKTITQSQQAALDAFAELVNDVLHDGKKLAAVLSYKNKQLAFHRFDRQPDQIDYWRDRLHEIELPHAGRPKTLNGRPVQIYLDEHSIAIATRLGDGNISSGIRIALAKTDNA